jgi:O-antigen/teichoic acid export membrane protein
MLTFVGHSSLRATLKVASRRLDVLLLGHYRSAADVGLYQAALRLAQVLEELTDPLYFAAFPQLARSWGWTRPPSISRGAWRCGAGSTRRASSAARSGR